MTAVARRPIIDAALREGTPPANNFPFMTPRPLDAHQRKAEMSTISPARDLTPARAATGIEGFDDVLGGGFTEHRLFLIEGAPGSGKTTLSTQFMLEGVRQGEPVLYVTLSETAEELHAMARSHGWSLDGITIRELVPS